MVMSIEDACVYFGTKDTVLAQMLAEMASISNHGHSQRSGDLIDAGILHAMRDEETLVPGQKARSEEATEIEDPVAAMSLAELVATQNDDLPGLSLRLEEDREREVPDPLTKEEKARLEAAFISLEHAALPLAELEVRRKYGSSDPDAHKPCIETFIAIWRGKIREVAEASPVDMGKLQTLKSQVAEMEETLARLRLSLSRGYVSDGYNHREVEWDYQSKWFIGAREGVVEDQASQADCASKLAQDEPDDVARELDDLPGQEKQRRGRIQFLLWDLWERGVGKKKLGPDEALFFKRSKEERQLRVQRGLAIIAKLPASSQGKRSVRKNGRLGAPLNLRELRSDISKAYAKGVARCAPKQLLGGAAKRALIARGYKPEQIRDDVRLTLCQNWNAMLFSKEQRDILLAAIDEKLGVSTMPAHFADLPPPELLNTQYDTMPVARETVVWQDGEGIYDG